MVVDPGFTEQTDIHRVIGMVMADDDVRHLSGLDTEGVERAEDGRLGQVVLGLDAARQGYWTAYGGTPGWAYLLDGFAHQLRERGLVFDEVELGAR